MYRGQWNGLHVGDAVAMHDTSDPPDFPLLAGVVAFVDGTPRVHGVGVRLSEGRHSNDIVWPARLRTHLDAHDPAERCLWCVPNPGLVSVDTGEPAVAVPEDVTAPQPDEPLASRQCGRCRQSFPCDLLARETWWLCPPCREVLLGGDRVPR